LTGNGAAPAQLLDSRRSAVFTHPDNTWSSVLGATLRGTQGLATDVTLTGNAYLRGVWTSTFNGDTSELEECQDPANAGLLCREDDGAEAPVIDTEGVEVPFDPANPLDATNHTTGTAQLAYGSTLQAVITRPVLGRENQLVVGASYAGGTARFSSEAEL